MTHVTVRLLTAERALAHEQAIPPFMTPPEIVIWGSRFFILPPGTVIDIDGAAPTATLEYVEAFAYWMV